MARAPTSRGRRSASLSCKTANVQLIATALKPVHLDGERVATIGTITIDNPDRRNAMTAAMYSAVPAACETLRAEPDLRAVVLRGAGDRAFCAGSDIREFGDRRMGDGAASYDRAEHLAWEALAAIEVPTVAVIHGHCRGGGVALALHCDLRLAADTAQFGVPPANLGLNYPPEATRRLMALVGPAWTKRLLFTAETIDADQAWRIGLVEEVLPAAELDSHATRLTQLMAEKAPLSQKAAKAVVDTIVTHGTAADRPLRDLSPGTAALAAACYDSDDFREGVRAFGEKRPPRFRGT